MTAPLECNQDRRPAHIDPQHWREWQGSGVSPEVIVANVRSLSGDEGFDYLCYSDKLERTNTGRLASKWLKTYGHTEAGGWWCNGLDPLNGWQPMQWGCFKPNCPRLPFEPGKKPIKYENPPKVSTHAFFLVVPDRTAQQVYKRHGVTPTDEDQVRGFWSVVWKYNIPVLIAEGCKKAACLLSHGYAAIALPGVYSGYRAKDALGNPITPYLIEDVKYFATPGREITLAFDQDQKPETRSKVNRALSRFGALLAQQGCSVRVAQWDSFQGKGPDDLIVNHGAEAFDAAYESALPLEHWKLWNRLDNRLTYKPSIKLKTQDLSRLEIDNLPDEGIFAFDSAKATGKTKLIGGLVADSEKVILGGHRICLMRNLCQRLGMDYKGDLDKANGQFINGSAYTLRVGLCLDSLLAIDPEKFRDCDLVLDETVQVLRHLLTSSTCKKEGKLPALLSRLHELVKLARRVILADADLNNASLDYIRELRGDSAPVYLIRNEYQRPGYPVKFIGAPDVSAITAELLKDVHERQPGEVILVQTDSKTGSKTLTRLVEQIEGLGCRLLLLNSETSGGEAEREFITTPDAVLARGEYDVIIASPSMATGVSIESDYITKVYGVFYGASSTDADMAQALSRARNPQAARVVWCAKRGLNFSKVSRSTNPLELKSDLKTRTDVSVSLIRSSLREDIAGAISSYDWQSDPHLNLWARIEADRNFSMHNLRTALLVRLKHEGHQVTVEDYAADPLAQAQLSRAKQEIKQFEANAVAGARMLTRFEAEELQSKEGLDAEDQLALARYYLADFYATTQVTPELVLWDANGRLRGELVNLEEAIYPGLAQERDAQSAQMQASWGHGIAPWNLDHAEVKRQSRSCLGLHDFFDPAKEWTKYDVKPYAEQARQYAPAVKTALNFTITEGMSDVQIIHQLLSQMGIKVKFRWQRINGEKLRVYSLDTARWQAITEVLTRRQQRRENFGHGGSDLGSSPSDCSHTRGDDPEQKQENTSADGVKVNQQIVDSTPFKVGNLVQVITGRFANHRGTIEKYDSINRECQVSGDTFTHWFKSECLQRVKS